MGFELHCTTSKNKSSEKFVECMQAAQEEVKAALSKVKDNTERYYNHQHAPALEYALGDK
ncbi:hypothetical protein DXG03_004524, partial [Asterophora parasitica]